MRFPLFLFGFLRFARLFSKSFNSRYGSELRLRYAYATLTTPTFVPLSTQSFPAQREFVPVLTFDLPRIESNQTLMSASGETKDESQTDLPRTILFLVGPKGVGKTTVLNNILSRDSSSSYFCHSERFFLDAQRNATEASTSTSTSSTADIYNKNGTSWVDNAYAAISQDIDAALATGNKSLILCESTGTPAQFAPWVESLRSRFGRWQKERTIAAVILVHISAPPEICSARIAQRSTTNQLAATPELVAKVHEKSMLLLQPKPQERRSPTAYLLFTNDARASFIAANPGLSNPQIRKGITEHWIKLTDAQRAAFEPRVRKAQEEYALAMKSYVPPPERLERQDFYDVLDASTATVEELATKVLASASPPPRVAVDITKFAQNNSSPVIEPGYVQLPFYGIPDPQDPNFPDSLRESFSEGGESFEVEGGLECCECGERGGFHSCYLWNGTRCCTKDCCTDMNEPATIDHITFMIQKSYGIDPDYWEKIQEPACYEEEHLRLQFPDEWCNNLTHADCMRYYRNKYSGCDTLFSDTMGLVPAGSDVCLQTYLYQIYQTSNLGMHDSYRLKPLVIGIKRVEQMSAEAMKQENQGSIEKRDQLHASSLNHAIGLLRALDNHAIGGAWTYVHEGVADVQGLLLTMAMYLATRRDPLPEIGTIESAVVRTLIHLVHKVDPMFDAGSDPDEDLSNIMRNRLKELKKYFDTMEQVALEKKETEKDESVPNSRKKQKTSEESPPPPPPPAAVPKCTLEELTEAINKFIHDFGSDCGF